MVNQYGYNGSEPNAPWAFRDQMQKCIGCGSIFAASRSGHCNACATGIIKDAVEEMHKAILEL